MHKYRILAIDTQTKIAEMACNVLHGVHGQYAEDVQDTPEAAKEACDYLASFAVGYQTFMVIRVQD